MRNKGIFDWIPEPDLCRKADKNEKALGVVIQSIDGSQPMVLQYNKPGRLVGYLKPEHEALLSPGTFVEVETKTDNKNEKIWYVCRVEKITGGTRYIKEMHYRTQPQHRRSVDLDPIKELVRDEHGNLSLAYPKFRYAHGKVFYFPEPAHLRIILGLSERGAPLGFAAAPGGCDWQRIPYFHPLSDLAHGYTGIFVVGKQGRGKTTLGRVLAKSFSEYTEPPAVIILDGEGEYLALNTPNPNLTEKGIELQKRLEVFGKCRNVHIYPLANSSVNGNYTLALSEIRGVDVPLFLSGLPQKSKEELESICARAFEEHRKLNGSLNGLTFQKLIPKLHTMAYGRVLHWAQRSAIERVLSHAPLSLFREDKLPLKLEEMIQPGRVSVITDTGFTSQDQSIVGLYVLLCLSRLKIDARKDDVGTILLIDEATRRLPTKYSDDHLRTRIVEKLNATLHVGRKRSFMPILMTQYPDDVPKGIRDLCGLQIVFQSNVSGGCRWLNHNLRNYKKHIGTLPVGEALVDSAAHEEPVHLKIPPSPTKEKGTR